MMPYMRQNQDVIDGTNLLNSTESRRLLHLPFLENSTMYGTQISCINSHLIVILESPLIVII